MAVKEARTVQEIRKGNELVKWYMDEAYGVYDKEETNKIGITFWLLMAQLTEREEKEK